MEIKWVFYAASSFYNIILSYFKYGWSKFKSEWSNKI